MTNAEGERWLLHAFRSFREAASALELSYASLRADVERLRDELAISNSDLARSSEENRRMRTYLDRILERLPCGVLVVSPDGSISKINPEAQRLLSIGNPSAAITRALGELPETIKQLLDAARRSGREQEMSAPPGMPEQWLSARHSSTCEGNGGASIFILRDISERKRFEEAQDRRRRDQALAEISAVLAHEIRNPLGSLELFAGLLAESGLASEPQQWVEHLQAGLRTLAATVNNVLHFHSLPEPQRFPLDLGELLDWAANFFLPLARQSSIDLGVQNHAAGIVLLADRHRLEQVLLNLVLNSIRAMPDGGSLEITALPLPQEQSVAIEVSDRGPGIQSGDLSQIFNPGFTRRAGSPGLGLAVCRKIVAQHGGTICGKNRSQGGATFTVTLPLVAYSAKGSHE